MSLGAVAALVEAVDGLDVGIDAAELRAALAARDVLDAKVALAVAAFEAAAAHEAQGAVSMRGWLRQEAGLDPRSAMERTAIGRTLAAVPALAASVLAGRLTGGQVNVILAHVPTRHRARFAEHAPGLVPCLEPLSVDATARAMREWRRRADAADERGHPDDHESTLHLSTTLDGVGVVHGSLSTDDTALLDTALRVADSGDLEVPAARRRAQALSQICQHFLDHQHRTPAGRRHRPHLNVVLTPTDGGAGVAGRYVDLDAPVSSLMVGMLGCDADWHRLLLDAPSARLDYGRATRDWAPDLYNAIVLRDGGCRVAGCDAPAAWCDVHHVEHWEDGGETRIGTGLLACRRHHVMLHRPGYHLKLLPDGTAELTSPTGEVRISYPRGPGWRPPDPQLDLRCRPPGT